MTEDFARLYELTQGHPRLFPPAAGMPWSQGHCAGWIPLLDLLCKRVEDLLASNPDAAMRVREMGQKRGALHVNFLLTGADPVTRQAILDAIALARLACYHVCPQCGAGTSPSLTLEKLIGRHADSGKHADDNACDQCRGTSG